MQFENTVWLIVGLIVSLGLGWAFYASEKGRAEALSKFASNHLLAKLTESVSPGRKRLKQVLLILAVVSVFVALARPQVGFRWEEAKRKGIDIMLAIDTSKSMLARDVAPNRLERSKLGIMDFIEKLGGDRVGLIPFAGDAFLMTPLTLDYGAFLESLRAVDTRTIPRGGSNIAAAIQEADRAFVDDAKQKILVLITDGEDLEGEALSAAQEAKDKGITVHTIGVGTPAGELIPAGRTARKGRFVKDGKGQMVKSRLDEGTLKKIASVTGGTYHPLGSRGEGLSLLYGQQLNLIPKQELSERMRKVPIDRFEWPLAMALLLLLLEFTIGDRKSRRAMRAPNVETADRRMPRPAHGVASMAVLGVLSVLVVSLAQASPQEAQQAYGAGDYKAAESQYEKASRQEPANEELLYNLGVAAYKNGNFDKSVDVLQRTLQSTDLGLQHETYYNLGNALYRKGQAMEKSEPDQTMEQWQQALKSYQGAMKLNEQDTDAKFNYEFVKKKLEELKKKQQQKQDKKQNKQSKQNQNKQDKQNQNDKNKSGKGQDKQNKSQSGKDQKKQDQKSGNNQKNSDDQKKQDEKSAKGSKPDQKDGKKKDRRHASGQDGDKKKAPKQKGDQQQAKGKPKPDNGNQADVRQSKGKPGEKKPGQQASAASGERRRPGQMSKEEAKRLLDSLKRDDQQVSFVPDKKGSGRANKTREFKDW